ncbi:hypothetical protein [Maribacter sp. 2-571]|uniref:hypothetical protein n=1 Tax=Maribacter sp. 2-571 TaxID=3417569 RepID=UPI003D34E628
MNYMKTVSVFKTSVNKKQDIKRIRPLLNRLIATNGRWNFDLEDCDRILRVESQVCLENEVINLLRYCNHECQALE